MARLKAQVERERQRANKRAEKAARKAAIAERKANSRRRQAEEEAARISARAEREASRQRWAEKLARDASDLAEYREGKNTPGAKRARIIIEEVRARSAAVDRVGDPLNLRPHHRRSPAKKPKKKKPEPDELQEESILDPDGGGRITILHRGFSLRGYQEHLVRAADQFSRDWHTAYAGGIKAASFTPKVDGTAAGAGPHVTRIDAQKRMQSLREYLREELWLLMLATVVHGYSPLMMQQRGLGSASTFAVKVKHALDVTAAFYGSSARRRNPAIIALTRLIADGERQASL